MNKCRSWNMILELERFYITKKNGKLRPIGSPTYESRMISKALNDLIYFIHEDKLAQSQHAYRFERGTHTALIDVWMRTVLLKHRHIYEFDFKSYFNNVKVD
jgi:retron-type reverse transcriptase